MSDEGVYEENCVHALSLILWEMFTDAVPFSDSTPSKAGEIVCEGGVGDIGVLNGMDEHLCHIISSTLMKNGRHRVGFDELQSLLREYAEEVVGGEDQSISHDTATINMQDNSELGGV